MYINVEALLFFYSGNQGNAVSLLFHKRHLLSESYIAFLILVLL